MLGLSDISEANDRRRVSLERMIGRAVMRIACDATKLDMDKSKSGLGMTYGKIYVLMKHELNNSTKKEIRSRRLYGDTHAPGSIGEP
jgi:hypothetical protein